MFKKLFYVVALTALMLTAILPGTAAYAQKPAASGVKSVDYAVVTNAELVGTSPVSIKLTGSIACDQPVIATTVYGSTIIILALDLQIEGSSRPCGAPQSGTGVVVVPSSLPAGKYSVLVNPNLDGSGAQKILNISVP